MSAPSLRVVVRLPGPRPENPIPDPPQIEWTSEKADILWKVIERSRSSDSGGADWKGLAAHLQVPLPYLLYRVNARFQEEIRGLKDIQDTLGPSGQPSSSPYAECTSPRSGERPTAIQRLQMRMTGSTHLSSSSKFPTPLGVRARLNSLTNNAPRLTKKIVSSSTLTLQPSRKGNLPLRPASPFSESEGDDSEEEAEARKEEEAERAAEEQETLARKLEDLQKMVTNEAIGLVSTARPRRRSLNLDRGRLGALSPRSVGSSYRPDTLSSRSGSQSVSDSSPQGSIPDIPSPPAGSSQPHSPLGRHLSSDRTGNRATHNGDRVHRNYVHSDGYGSSHDSETSSFTDLSDASVSASALESALMSNIRGGGSRLSQYAPSRVISRSNRLPR